MNCKPGDIAMVIVAWRNHGALVEVLRADDGRDGPNGIPYLDEGDAAWVVRSLGAGLWIEEMFSGEARGPYMERVMSDSALRPIRPGDADDETLTWAGKPAELLPADVIREVTA